jgi:DNA-binding transcriptional regulator YbjK
MPTELETYVQEHVIGKQVVQATPPDRLARFVALDHERRETEDRLDTIKKEQAALQEELLEEWADRSQSSANIGNLTVYVAHDFYCNKRSEVSTEQIIGVLRSIGLEHCVQTGYNATSVKAFVKEELAKGSDIPEVLKDCLNYDTVPRLRTRLNK